MPARQCGVLLLITLLSCGFASAEEQPALVGFSELKEFLRLLEAGETATSDSIKLRAVHFAAFRGETEKATQLVEVQDLKTLSMTTGFSPMHAAAAGRSVATVEALLRKNVPAHVSTPMGWTPVHIACSNSDLAMLTVLLAHGGNASIKQEGGLAPVHVACARGQIECVKLLLKNGADVNALTKTDSSTMHFAVPNLEMMRLLVEFKARVDYTDFESTTPALLAIKAGRIDAIQFLQKHGAELKPMYFHVAVQTEQKAVFDYLLTQRLDFDATSLGETTPLHVACRKKDIYYARTLSERGVKISPAMVGGDTPLHLAAAVGTLEMVQLLLDKGASVTFFNKDQETALFPAALAGRQDVIEAILKKGADVQWKRADGATIVEVAEKAGHGQLAAYLRSLRVKQ